MTRAKLNGVKILAPAFALVLLASGCAASADTAASDASIPDGSAAQVGADGHTNYPLTIANCDVELTFEAPPKKVVLLESSPVTIMQGLGVLDAATLRAGAFPAEYFDAETNAAIDAIPSLGDNLDNSGHLQISQEIVIAEQPELVMGLPDGITREGLASAGIQALLHPTFCPTGVTSTTFDSLYDEITNFGLIFDRNAEAVALIAELQGRVEAVEADASGMKERTAAVLYPAAGGIGYAYGNTSMAHPQMQAAGFTNVFGEVDERVFEVSLEELIARDPDVLVLLYTDGDPDAVKAAITNLPGADALRAVTNGNILVQLFNFTEPPTPLSVDGLERITARFGTGQ